MRPNRRTFRDVLHDKKGIATSLPDALAGISMQTLTMGAIATALVGVTAFYALSSASADTSGAFQNTNLTFQKSVAAADVVYGVGQNRVGILKDVGTDQCKVETWQAGTRDGKATLQLDTATVPGVCTPTTALAAAGSTDTTRELVYDVRTPAFTYANLGGREITYSSAGVPTLTTGTKPSDVKQGDWDDTRPYKVSLKLQTLNGDTAVTTKNAVTTGYTNVVNVTAAKDSLRYVPAPSTDPIPGPIKITGTTRSSVKGDTVGGVREGIAITFNGGVCASGPTKVVASFTQQDPSAAEAVNTVINQVLTGDSTTVDLGAVPNGASGAVQVAATCIDGGVVVKDGVAYTQPIPKTNLTVTQNADSWKHDLAWTKVSSLPTQFEVRRAFAGDSASDELVTTTDALSVQSVYEQGMNLGMTSTYSVVATVGDTKSPAATASITTPLPKPDATVVTPTPGGATWTAVTCPAFSNAQYAERHYQQVGTDTKVTWSTLSAWSTDRSLTKIVTPGYGRTMYEVQARCVATKSDAVSPASVSETIGFYQPEDVSLAAARSTTVGTTYAGVREGVTVLLTGARCYNGTKTEVHVTWAGPTGTSEEQARTQVFTTGSTSWNFANAANGGEGEAEAWTQCVGVNSGSSQNLTTYTNPLPTPTITVKQGPDAETHIVSWNDISSLPVTYTVYQNTASSATDVAAAKTTAQSKTFVYADGGTYGNKADYSVAGVVNGEASARATNATITTAWPASPSATGIKYTRTTTGDYEDGKVTWGWDASCPAGTGTQGRLLENRTGTRSGSIDTTVRATSAWTNRPTSYNWAPSYSTQGYAYGVRVDGKCVSSVTGFESKTDSTQSSNWITGMAQPKAPVWDAYNYQEMKRGTNWTYNTPLNQNFQTISIDYITYCPSGSSMDWSSFTSRSWAGNDFYHPIGYRDYWQLPDDLNRATVTYYNTKYNCSTPWATSPQSPAAPNKVIEVRR